MICTPSRGTQMLPGVRAATHRTRVARTYASACRGCAAYEASIARATAASICAPNGHGARTSIV